jgi:hypothetical protein
VSHIVAEKSDNGTVESEVVIVAHYGSRDDHVILLKTMIICDLTPPAWRFSDSLPIFKLLVQPNEDGDAI